jgi:hypothetical protein
VAPLVGKGSEAAAALVCRDTKSQSIDQADDVGDCGDHAEAARLRLMEAREAQRGGKGGRAGKRAGHSVARHARNTTLPEMQRAIETVDAQLLDD